MHRILVIDDNPAIHNDIRKILAKPEPDSNSLEEAESLLFGTETTEEEKAAFFDIDSAFLGQEVLELVLHENCHTLPRRGGFAGHARDSTA